MSETAESEVFDGEIPLTITEKHDFWELTFRQYWTKLKAMQKVRREQHLAQCDVWDAQEECNFLEMRIANEESKIEELESEKKKAEEFHEYVGDNPLR